MQFAIELRGVSKRFLTPAGTVYTALRELTFVVEHDGAAGHTELLHHRRREGMAGRRQVASVAQGFGHARNDRDRAPVQVGARFAPAHNGGEAVHKPDALTRK